MLSDTQLLTIALATVPTLLVVAIGILLNNHRLNDVKETLRAEIKAGDAAILSQMATYQMDIISKIAELDNRITRLER
jgi:cellobiose-specific phosphotransferase system component IIC